MESDAVAQPHTVEQRLRYIRSRLYPVQPLRSHLRFRTVLIELSERTILDALFRNYSE